MFTIIAIFVLLTLPWLNPFSIGPSPAVAPLLFSWACAAVLIGMCSLASGRMTKTRMLSATAAAWLVAALLSSAIGLLQYFGATAVFGQWVNSTGLGEAYANLRQRNQFATLTNIGLAALLWWVAQTQAKTGTSENTSPPNGFNWQPAMAMAAAALLAMGNAASSSRTGLMQLALLLVMAAIWGGWRQPAVRRVWLTAALFYGAAAWALPVLLGLDPLSAGILARLHDGGPSCASRLTLWSNVLHLIDQKPWFGWGWGQLDYAHFITLYPGPRFCEILDNAHNLPLHLAVELGVPLALLVCGGGLWLAWRAKPWREADATRQMAWMVLAVILLHSLLEYPLWYGPFQMAFGLSIWLLWRKPVPYPGNSGVFRLLAPVLSGVLATILIAFSAYAAWDYHRISQIYLPPAMRSEAYRDNTLQKIGDSYLFRDQLRFAELSIAPLKRGNATHLHELAKSLLHFSPEPRVIEKVIESSLLLKHDDEALYYLVRYRAAFPESHARWSVEK